MCRIGFLVFPGCSLPDFTDSLIVSDVADRLAAQLAYRTDVSSEGGAQVQSAPGLVMQTQSLDGSAFDTSVISGDNGPRKDASSPWLIVFVREVTAYSRHMTNVYSGAFALAVAGLLDGHRAATHWHMAALLQRRYPRVQVQNDHVLTHDGPAWMSAGISSGIDLALVLIEKGLGVDVSRVVARELVVYHRRPDGQSQFSTLLELDPASSHIAQALGYAREHPHETLDVGRLAEIAHLSHRRFGRAFMAETDQTPTRAIEKLRIEIARPRMETGDESLKHIVHTIGFTDPEYIRRAFIRMFGQPPQSVRYSGRSGYTRLAAQHATSVNLLL